MHNHVQQIKVTMEAVAFEPKFGIETPNITSLSVCNQWK